MRGRTVGGRRLELRVVLMAAAVAVRACIGVARQGPAVISLTRVGRVRLVVVMLAGGLVAAVVPASASASVRMTALVYGPALDSSPSCSSSSPYPSSCGEVQYLEAQGWTVTVTDQGGNPAWNSGSYDFARYQLLVFPDPNCDAEGSDTTLNEAVSNESTWAPTVNGSVIIIGTDPIYHEASSAGAATLIYHGLAYAGGQSGKTGLYLDLSCYYNTHTTSPQDSQILDGLTSALGDSPGFSVYSANNCASSVHVVATAPELVGVTDADLSNWACSVHEYFGQWPSDFVPYTLYTNVVGSQGSDPCPNLYRPPDGTAPGCPYILARGGGVSPGSVSLTGPSTSGAVGSNQTLTASVEIDGSPTAVVVTFTCQSGPCSTSSGTGTSDPSSGTATFTYNGAATGTDTWVASIATLWGTYTSVPAAVVWTKASTSFSAGASPTSTSYGNAVTLSASGLPSGATGSVTFSSGTSTLCTASVSSGPASCSTGVLAPGTYSVIASYGGDNNYQRSTAGTSFTISAASPSIATSAQPSSATVGSSIADQATVSGGDSPTGMVTFSLYNNPNGTGTPLFTDANEPLSSGVATSKGYTATATGTDYWVATYNGDSNNNSVSSGAASEPVSITAASKLADLGIAISGPSSAADRSSFTEKVTVSNAGPASAGDVLTAVLVPRGLAITNTGGGDQAFGTVRWTASQIAAGGNVTYTITLRVQPHVSGRVLIPAATVSFANPDPNYANNVAATTVVLGHDRRHASRASALRNPFPSDRRLAAYLLRLTRPDHATPPQHHGKPVATARAGRQRDHNRQ